MAAPDISTCEPWIEANEVCLGDCSDYTFDQALLEEMIQVASDVLYVLSGRKFPGECTDAIRPCVKPRCSSSADPIDGCRCSGLKAITLREYPATEITQVKVDGEVLESARYRLDENRWLVRLRDADGSRRAWPCCQDASLPDTEQGTFSVSYKYGILAPPAGRLAAARFACELALACDTGADGECKLPKRVTSVVRQGVSITTLDPFDFLEEGKTGVYEADLFLSTYNPGGGKGATIWSPDTSPRSRRVGA